jgi:predicted membrane metal-binding protein
MKLVYLILSWVFGVFFLLTGLLSIIESPLGGVCLIIMAALLLPPIRNFVYSKTKNKGQALNLHPHNAHRFVIPRHFLYTLDMRNMLV